MSGALAPAAMSGLDKATQETVVTQYLTTARERLSLALEATGPQAVATLRAEIATAAEATKQLGLSKEIQLDAQEMVRRAEYALAKAIRKGQSEGTVATGQGGDRATVLGTVASPLDFAKDVELYDRPSQGKTGILSFADRAHADEAFDAALDQAKAEGNLSRANVARHITPAVSKGKTADDVIARMQVVSDLAARGHTSRQIADRIGQHVSTVRKNARDHGIEIPADRVMGKSSRAIDSNRIAQETVSALEGLALGLRLFDPDNADPAQADEWATSLNDSLRALNRFRKQIKEMTL